MSSISFKHIYGPVYSWRLGYSLGVDPLTVKSKICNYDCTYCQLGRSSDLTTERQNFISTTAILEEIRELPADVPVDVITFSGRGEPTLAKNLGEMIRAIQDEFKKKVAVITNSALLDDEDVVKDLQMADIVLTKLDSGDQISFEAVDKPAGVYSHQKIVEGIKNFRQLYQGHLALQMMFVESNQDKGKQMAEIAREIGADEIQINTPLRSCPDHPLPEEKLNEIKSYFDGLPAYTVYEKEKKELESARDPEAVKRHGRTRRTVSE